MKEVIDVAGELQLAIFLEWPQFFGDSGLPRFQGDTLLRLSLGDMPDFPLQRCL